MASLWPRLFCRSARNEERRVLGVHKRRETPRCGRTARPLRGGVGQTAMRRCESLLGDHPSARLAPRSEEHTSELQSLMRISYAVFCLKTKNITKKQTPIHTSHHIMISHA